MFVIKCECGCTYSIKESQLDYHTSEGIRTCPGCRKPHSFEGDSKLSSMFGGSFEIYRIPDDKKEELFPYL